MTPDDPPEFAPSPWKAALPALLGVAILLGSCPSWLILGTLTHRSQRMPAVLALVALLWPLICAIAAILAAAVGPEATSGRRALAVVRAGVVGVFWLCLAAAVSLVSGTSVRYEIEVCHAIVLVAMLFFVPLSAWRGLRRPRGSDAPAGSRRARAGEPP